MRFMRRRHQAHYAAYLHVPRASRMSREIDASHEEQADISA